MQNAKQIIVEKVIKTASKPMFCGGFWSEWGDSNSRHLAPKASALPTALHPDNLIFLYGVGALQIKTASVS